MSNARELSGMQALKLATEVSKVQDGTFSIAYYQYNRVTGQASSKLVVKHGCKVRTQLPREAWEVDGENYFLFFDAEGNHKTCWRILIRFMGFPQDNYNLRKINWIW